MSIILGRGQYRYEELPDWGRLPEGWDYREVAGVAVDSRDQVYVFNRGRHPVIVFDREGRFLRSFGEDLVTRAHGIDIGPDDTVYLTDDESHIVKVFHADGRPRFTIGLPGKAAPYMSGMPFHLCTHTALSPQGDIYVADGYGNARVHKYSPDGKLLFSWGEPGTDPGQFNIVHNICTDPEGYVYVADRENHRVQVFRPDGRFEAQWHNLHRPCGLHMTRGRDPLCYIGELGPAMPVNRHVPNIGPRLSIVDRTGHILARVGTEKQGEAPGQFVAPHGVAVDSHGDIYVGEVSATVLAHAGDLVGDPRSPRSLRKLVRRSESE
jgi:DNA-binding beta-propeller fold protein YncE